MKVIGIIPKTESEAQKYIIEATEKELDKISGIAEVEHIEGRIKVGHELLVSEIYNKLDYFAKHQRKLENTVSSLREIATTIKNLLPKET